MKTHNAGNGYGQGIWRVLLIEYERMASEERLSMGRDGKGFIVERFDVKRSIDILESLFGCN